MSSLAHNTQNDTRFEDFLADVRQYGRDSAAGGDALPKLAIRALRAANDGLLDTKKNKHGEGVDDAAKVYEEYAKAESKKAIHEHSSNGKKANVSKLRQIITMGGNTNIDPVEVMNRAIEVRERLIREEVKVKGAYPAFVDVARAQNAQEQEELSDAQLEECIRKPVSEGKDLEDIWQSILKNIEKLISGEHSSGHKDQSDEAIAAHDAVKKRIEAIVYGRENEENQKLYEQAIESGFDVTPDQVAAVAALLRKENAQSKAA